MNDVLELPVKAQFSAHIHLEILDMIQKCQCGVPKVQSLLSCLCSSRGPRIAHQLSPALSKVCLPQCFLLLDQVQLLTDLVNHTLIVQVLAGGGERPVISISRDCWQKLEEVV